MWTSPSHMMQFVKSICSNPRWPPDGHFTAKQTIFIHQRSLDGGSLHWKMCVHLPILPCLHVCIHPAGPVSPRCLCSSILDILVLHVCLVVNEYLFTFSLQLPPCSIFDILTFCTVNVKMCKKGFLFLVHHSCQPVLIH
jgi:hypothetical protein